MTQSSARGSNFGKTVLLVALGVAAVVAIALFGLVDTVEFRAQSSPMTIAASPAFEVASIKPNRSTERRGGLGLRPGRFTTTNARTKMVIAFAYHVQDFQVLEGPSWIDSDKYDFDAKVDDSLAIGSRNFPPTSELISSD
jgi:hypothetical protein